MQRIMICIGLAPVALLAVTGFQPAIAGDSDSQAFELALIGDAPYGVPIDADAPKLERMTREINNQSNLRWVLHAGDIKSQGAPCSKAMYEDRLARLQRFDAPVVLTPGDNDWTDCHSAEGDWRTLQRLAKLREVFFAEPVKAIGEASMNLTSQAEEPTDEGVPENVRWQYRGVMFATVHMTGSLNGTRDYEGRGAEHDAEVAQRTQAGVAWVNAIFDAAEADDAKGVLVLTHANPGIGRKGADDIPDVFIGFLDTLRQRAVDFDNPVVLAHGDTHYFRVDKPLLPKLRSEKDEPGVTMLGNFTRVESFGEPMVHWVRITVDPSDPEVFSFEQELVDSEA